MSKDHPQSTPGHAKPMPGLADDAEDHSMKEEPALGWDQAPVGTDAPDPHRHPRQAGKGGSPDVGENPERDVPMGENTSSHAQGNPAGNASSADMPGSKITEK